MGDTKNRKQIGATMDKQLYARLKAYSDKTMIPMSRVIEKAILEYLEKDILDIAINEYLDKAEEQN